MLMPVVDPGVDVQWFGSFASRACPAFNVNGIGTPVEVTVTVLVWFVHAFCVAAVVTTVVPVAVLKL